MTEKINVEEEMAKLRNEVNLLKAREKKTAKAEDKTPLELVHQQTAVEAVLNCPHCYSQVAEEVHKRDKAEQENKSPAPPAPGLPPEEPPKPKDAVCKDCGTEVYSTDPECPTCKGKHARWKI